MSLDHAPASPAAPRHRPGSPSDNGDDDDLADPAPSQEQRRRRLLVVLAVATGVAVVAGIATVVTSGDGNGSGEGAGDATTDTTTVPVEVRDLVVADDYEGELGYGETDAVSSGRDGVVTGTAGVGSTVTAGQALFHVDLQPTVLLHGEVPVFRDLSVDADPGADVTQLEQGLVNLGFGEGVTVDDTFDGATAEAVAEWEESLGRSDPDGVVSLGDVVFAPADLRVAEVSADRGTQVQSGATVLEATGTAKVVTLELSVDQVAQLEAGTRVAVVLPDGTETTGSVTDVATEPSSDDDSSDEGSGGAGGLGGGGAGGDGGDGGTGGDGEDTFPVTVSLDDPAVAGAFDSGAVDVSIERSRTEDGVAVPVTALLALAEGGYALQVADDSQPGGYRLVAVEVGTIADEWAEVTGDGIEDGVEVVVPA